MIETPGFIPHYSGMKNLKILNGLSEHPASNETLEKSMELVGLDPKIYESGKAFFTTYIEALQKGEDTYTVVENTPNKTLVLPVLLREINETLLPSLNEVLNQGFALKEKTNKIYIEGVEDSMLISPEEVMSIIENPYSILPPRPQVSEAPLVE